MCLILFLLAHPPLHLHRWWSNHERSLPEPTGSEKPWCLVSVGLVPRRSLAPSVSVCSRASFMGDQNAERSCFLLLYFLKMGSQEQPRAMEQNWAYSTVQSTNGYAQTYPDTHFLTFFHYPILSSKHISLKENACLTCYLVTKSTLPCQTDCSCLCMFAAVCS